MKIFSAFKIKFAFFGFLPLLASCSAINDTFWQSRLPDDINALGEIKVEYIVDGIHLFGPSGINSAFIVYSISDKVAQAFKNGELNFLVNLESAKKFEKLEQDYEKSHTNNGGREKDEKRFAYRDSVLTFFKDWKATPVQETEEDWTRSRSDKSLVLKRQGMSLEERWLEYKGRSKPNKEACSDISICSFYGDYKEFPEYLNDPKYLERIGAKKEQNLESINFTSRIKSNYVDISNIIIKSPDSYFGYGIHGVLIIAPEYKKIIYLHRS